MNPAAVGSAPPLAASTVADLIRARRTIHEFTGAMPPRELVLDALDAARWAPNHHRTEPWRFILLGPQSIARVVELNTELVRAKNGEAAAEKKRARWIATPGWLVVTCRRSEDAATEREDYAACCCAIQNIALTLWAGGIGTKWSTGKVTRDARFMSAIGADAALEFCVGLLWYGYAREVPAQARRPLAEVLRDVD
jgi:nitroreductase